MDRVAPSVSELPLSPTLGAQHLPGRLGVCVRTQESLLFFAQNTKSCALVTLREDKLEGARAPIDIPSHAHAKGLVHELCARSIFGTMRGVKLQRNISSGLSAQKVVALTCPNSIGVLLDFRTTTTVLKPSCGVCVKPRLHTLIALMSV